MGLQDNGRVNNYPRLSLLIELLYGFAIANGMADALKSTIESGTIFHWIFLGVAILLALGDWLGYHVHVASIPYRSLGRLLIDMLFPALVYCLMMAPTLKATKGDVNYVALIVFIYFFFAIVYAVLLERETKSENWSLNVTLLTSYTISLSALLFSYAVPVGFLAWIVNFEVTLAVAIWAGYNMYQIHLTMRMAKYPEHDANT